LAAALNTWGSDRVVFLFATEPLPSLEVKIREALAAPVSITGTKLAEQWRPSGLAAVLANAPAAEVAALMTPLAAVLLEIHQGERWAVFARADLEPTLQRLGFVAPTG
jgi:hypothetical protein